MCPLFLSIKTNHENNSIMNTNSNWRGALNMANADLKKYNVFLQIEQEDNTYNINIVYPDNVEQYACGYFENELEDLINDARSWVVNNKENVVDMTAKNLMEVFVDCRQQVITALERYVEQYGEPYSNYHQNVLEIKANEGETIIKVANLYDAKGCAFINYLGEGKFETITVIAICLTRNTDGKHLKVACFGNVDERSNDDKLKFCTQPIDTFTTNELFEMIKAIQNIKTK